MNTYTDKLIEEYMTELSPHWVELSIEPWRFNYLAQNWICPKNADNRQILSEEDWEKEKQAFLQMGKNVNVSKQAEICLTYYNKQYNSTSYLVWLNFIGPDGSIHTIDAWIAEKGKTATNAIKHIDERSPKCADILEMIKETGYIPAKIAKLLQTIGATTWEGTAESKVQSKLNSFIQENIFEDTLKELGIEYKKLDVFGDYLYRGDPGSLSDFDIIIDGIITRVDLKLLSNESKLVDQKFHDADMLISSSWQDAHIDFYRIFGEPSIEEKDIFKQLLTTFSLNQKNKGQCFIRINSIDGETGKVDFVMFGNNK